MSHKYQPTRWCLCARCNQPEHEHYHVPNHQAPAPRPVSDIREVFS